MPNSLPYRIIMIIYTQSHIVCFSLFTENEHWVVQLKKLKADIWVVLQYICRQGQIVIEQWFQ